jgi:hypothetical protein
MSKASELARARSGYYGPRVPTIDPTDAVNRAKETEGIPHPDTNPLNPKGVATVNGVAVEGAESPYTPLPEGLTAAARASLEAAELTTLERVAAMTDDALLALDGVGPATVKLLRDAADG